MTRNLGAAVLAALWGSGQLGVDGHGYLKAPRSRNLVAYQDKEWEHPSEKDPFPEDCPHCLNLGGTLAQCGLLTGVDAITLEQWERNYDTPKNVLGDPMPPNIQASYIEGDIIEIEVLLTTHHKGHFVFSACPIAQLRNRRDKVKLPMEIPTEECFQSHKLKFVEDVLYGAPPDPNYPERAYIAPAGLANWVGGTPEEQPVLGARYIMKMELPKGVWGDVVLLQWYYLTANSCKHEGYENYDFPESWGSDVGLYKRLPDCGELPPDGHGVPEQFWNCAEIAIEMSSNIGHSPAQKPAEATPISEVAVEVTRRVAPTPYVLCEDASTNYYQATEDCSGYVYCLSGQASSSFPCGSGLLYDERKQMCGWANEVTCDTTPRVEAMNTNDNQDDPPRTPPPPAPTPHNPLYEWTHKPRGYVQTIIGYYASWQWYDRNGLAAPANMDFSKITRANFAFFQITTDGMIYGTDSWADPITLFGFYDWMSGGDSATYCSWDAPYEPPNCSAHHYKEGLIYLAHAAGAEVYPSIGGWSLSDPFPAMAADPVARKTFADQCVELIKNYNFDGIDLDWEYPGYEPHSGTPDDTVNFNLLLDDVREALDDLEKETGKYYGLTAALPCGPSIIANQDIAHVSKRLTELNLMTYDFHGSWNDNTGVNAPLFDQEGSPEFSVHGCVLNWLEGGADQSKINIGFPFYGRSFAAAKHLYESHQGTDMSSWSDDEGVPQYYNIVAKRDLTTVRDERTATQYGYSEVGMVSFDDERAICDKTTYAIDNHLNGYIIWELSGDLMPDLTTPLLDAANVKLLNPRIDCATSELLDAIASFGGSKREGGNGSDNNGSDKVYYPSYEYGHCIADGREPSWMQPSDLTNDEHSCCVKHFNWKGDCAKAPKVTTTMSNTPGTTTVLTRPTLPAISNNDETDTTTTAFPHPRTTSTTVTTATTTITTTSTAASNFETSHFVDLVPQYFPIFRSDGAVTKCQNIGTPPLWLDPEDLKDTVAECCEAFAFPWHVKECLGLKASDSDASAFFLFASQKKGGYHPDFTKLRCVNDVTVPVWMTSDYFRDSLEECCRDFYTGAISFAYCNWGDRL